MDKDSLEILGSAWDRLRVLAITLQQADLEEGDVKTIGRMIDSILAEDLYPVIEKEEGRLNHESGDC